MSKIIWVSQLPGKKISTKTYNMLIAKGYRVIF